MTDKSQMTPAESLLDQIEAVSLRETKLAFINAVLKNQKVDVIQKATAIINRAVRRELNA